jgi:hypothetical protein
LEYVFNVSFTLNRNGMRFECAFYSQAQCNAFSGSRTACQASRLETHPKGN